MNSCMLAGGWKRHDWVINAADLSGPWVEEAKWSAVALWPVIHSVRKLNQCVESPNTNPPHPSPTHFPIRTLMRSPAQGCQNKWGDHVFAPFREECNRCSLEPQGNSPVVIIHVVLLCRETWTAPGIQCMWRQTERRGERQTTRDSLGHCQRHLGRFIRCCRFTMLSRRNEDSLCASLFWSVFCVTTEGLHSFFQRPCCKIIMGYTGALSLSACA